MPWWRRRWAPWAILAGGALATGPLAFVYRLAAPEPGDAGINCGGIGFGESPCGWDAVGLFYAFVGIPYALGVLTIVGLLELGGLKTHMARLGLASVAAVIPWGVALVALLTG